MRVTLSHVLRLRPYEAPKMKNFIIFPRCAHNFAMNLIIACVVAVCVCECIDGIL